MAKFVCFMAAVFVACIASPATACQKEIQKCSMMQPKEVSDMCSHYKDQMKCLTDAGAKCKDKSVMESTMSVIQTQMSSSCSGGAQSGAANPGAKPGAGNPLAGLGDLAKAMDPCTKDLLSCITSKKECETFKCVNKVRVSNDACKKAWKQMYTTKDTKKQYDALDKKCGCGSLKPSLLIVLASAILMFLRSHC